MSKRIVFMGTPDFAVESLKQLVESDVEVAAVITAPDRPAGRGQKLKSSPVKNFALEAEIKILQPSNLKDTSFLSQLQSINADLFVVVAFRMLPEAVWNMPPLGTINLHGSLLPNYRGAAPINWAVINGEQKTGATTFFLKHKIDTGDVIDTVEVEIEHTDTAGTVHDKLMIKGAELLKKSVASILAGNVSATPQENLVEGTLKEAPKIFKADCKINWAEKTEKVYNKIRGLSPYPTAWTEIENQGEIKSIKLFEAKDHIDGNSHTADIKVENGQLYFGTTDGWIEICSIQMEGKKRMSTADFLKGFAIQDWKLK